MRRIKKRQIYDKIKENAVESLAQTKTKKKREQIDFIKNHSFIHFFSLVLDFIKPVYKPIFLRAIGDHNFVFHCETYLREKHLSSQHFVRFFEVLLETEAIEKDFLSEKRWLSFSEKKRLNELEKSTLFWESLLQRHKDGELRPQEYESWRRKIEENGMLLYLKSQIFKWRIRPFLPKSVLTALRFFTNKFNEDLFQIFSEAAIRRKNKK